MATALCNLGYAHVVCDRCGSAGRDDDDRAERTAAVTTVSLGFANGGQLASAMLCDPCTYALRELMRGWMGGPQDAQ